MITLQNQIDFMQSMNDDHMNLTSKAILASLRRLQEIEHQEPVAWKYRHKYSYMEVIENTSVFDMRYSSSFEAKSLYALPVSPEGWKESVQNVITELKKPVCRGLDKPTEFALSQDKGMRINFAIRELNKLIAASEVSHD